MDDGGAAYLSLRGSSLGPTPACRSLRIRVEIQYILDLGPPRQVKPGSKAQNDEIRGLLRIGQKCSFRILCENVVCDGLCPFPK